MLTVLLKLTAKHHKNKYDDENMKEIDQQHKTLPRPENRSE